MGAIQQLFVEDMGTTIDALFSEFDPKPVGVASLAQVHKAKLKDGRRAAVKIQHPHLHEFAKLEYVLNLEPFWNTASNAVLG
jgi:aarF domain-containing kinase